MDMERSQDVPLLLQTPCFSQKIRNLDFLSMLIKLTEMYSKIAFGVSIRQTSYINTALRHSTTQQLQCDVDLLSGQQLFTGPT